MSEEKGGKIRFFSIELGSKSDLKNVTLSNGCRENALIEGTIGYLVNASFAEGLILEVVGDRGVLRINLEDREISRPKVGSVSLS